VTKGEPVADQREQVLASGRNGEKFPEKCRMRFVEQLHAFREYCTFRIIYGVKRTALGEVQ